MVSPARDEMERIVVQWPRSPRRRGPGRCAAGSHRFERGHALVRRVACASSRAAHSTVFGIARWLLPREGKDPQCEWGDMPGKIR